MLCSETSSTLLGCSSVHVVIYLISNNSYKLTGMYTVHDVPPTPFPPKIKTLRDKVNDYCLPGIYTQFF